MSRTPKQARSNVNVSTVKAEEAPENEEQSQSFGEQINESKFDYKEKVVPTLVIDWTMVEISQRFIAPFGENWDKFIEKNELKPGDKVWLADTHVMILSTAMIRKIDDEEKLTLTVHWAHRQSAVVSGDDSDNDTFVALKMAPQERAYSPD